MPLISTRNHVGIAPRGTRHCEAQGDKFSWGTSANEIADASDRVEECVEIAEALYNIHTERIFVAGYSTGGTMAHRLALQFPERFAGAISLGGRVPRGAHLLKNINRARKMPLMLAVSPDDGRYGTEAVMDDLRFVHSVGLPLALRLYPEGDDLTTTMFSDLNCWVMEQFCPTSAVAAS